jgi:ubiquinone/menaquinone biosynthesis C-methylase UbiE
MSPRVNMNRFHRWYCGSWHWRRHLTGAVLPQALDGIELGDSVLELGPGRGMATAWLAPRTTKLTSLELDPAMSADLAARFPEVDVIRGSATRIPFPDESFTDVVCTTMLHHVPTVADQDALFAEAHRVLPEHGAFCGSDSLMTPAFRFAHLGDVMNVVDPDTLASRLEAAGFSDIVISRGRDYFTFRASA